MTVLLLPGLFGSGEGHWQRHWLSDRADSRLVEQDDWSQPQVEHWIARLESVLEEVGESYIVAHSLGCLLAARLAGRPAARLVRGALLVAPCDLPSTEKLHPGRIAFGTMPTGRLPFPSLTIGSLDDHYMAIDRLTLFASLWHSELRNIGLAGHINIASGYGRWPSGYRLFDTFKARVGRMRQGSTVPARPDAVA